jgi:hypothetical protein
VRLRLVWPRYDFLPLLHVSEYIPFLSQGVGLLFVLTGLVRCEIVLLHLNVIFTLVCSQTYKALANIKFEDKVFPAVTLLQFCVSKSPPFNVTSLITVQLACNNTEVVNTLHPELIGRLHINRFLSVTQSECHAKYYSLIETYWAFQLN